MTAKEYKKLNSEFNKLNKEYISLDKVNEKETNESILFSNYARMDEISNEMVIIANLLEEASEDWKIIIKTTII